MRAVRPPLVLYIAPSCAMYSKARSLHPKDQCNIPLMLALSGDSGFNPHSSFAVGATWGLLLVGCSLPQSCWLGLFWGRSTRY